MTFRGFAAVVLALALLVLGPPTARAADAGTDNTVSVTPGVQVRVRTVGRPVRVTGWARSDVKVASTEDLPNVSVSEDRSRVTISGAIGGGALVEVFVPAASHVEVRSVGGSVVVTDVTGSLRLATVDGALTVRGAPREVEAESVSGNVELDLAACVARTSSVSGSVRVQCKGKTGRLYGKTVSGALTVSGVSFERLELRTVSARVEVDGKVAGDGPFELRSHSGNVTLTIPKGTPVILDARSTRGRIDANASAAPNAPTVTLRTFSGDVRVVEK